MSIESHEKGRKKKSQAQLKNLEASETSDHALLLLFCKQIMVSRTIMQPDTYSFFEQVSRSTSFFEQVSRSNKYPEYRHGSKTGYGLEAST